MGEHSHKLEGDLFFRLENALRDLNDLGAVEIDHQAKTLFKRSLALTWPDARPDIWKTNLELLRPLAPWDQAKIFEPGGQCPFTDTPASSTLWSLDDLLHSDKMAAQLLAVLRGKDSTASSATKGKNAPADSFLGRLVTSNLFENYDIMGELSSGGEIFSMMLIPLMGSDGRVGSLLHLVWNRWHLERFFLQKHLLSFARDLPDTHLLVWHPNVPDRCFPRRSPFWKPLIPLFPGIRDQTGFFGGRVRVGRDDYLVTAIRSDAFRGAFLVAISSNRFIRSEITEAIFRVVFGGLLLAFGSMLVAMIFTQSFLYPLSLLGQGIAALRARKFHIRLPETGRDELGSLVSGFNRMADGLQDMEGASRVRAILYPPVPLEIPPFAFCGKSPGNQTLGRQILILTGSTNEKWPFSLPSATPQGLPPVWLWLWPRGASAIHAPLRIPFKHFRISKGSSALFWGKDFPWTSFTDAST
jgi:HAMP domain-containing protein